MNIIYVLIPIGIILVAVAILVFFWAVRSNQFEDLERQGYSILFDEDDAAERSGHPAATTDDSPVMRNENKPES